MFAEDFWTTLLFAQKLCPLKLCIPRPFYFRVTMGRESVPFLFTLGLRIRLSTLDGEAAFVVESVAAARWAFKKIEMQSWKSGFCCCSLFQGFRRRNKTGTLFCSLSISFFIGIMFKEAKNCSILPLSLPRVHQIQFKPALSLSMNSQFQRGLNKMSLGLYYKALAPLVDRSALWIDTL